MKQFVVTTRKERFFVRTRYHSHHHLNDRNWFFLPSFVNKKNEWVRSKRLSFSVFVLFMWVQERICCSTDKPKTCIVWIIQYFLLWVPVWLRWRLLVCRHVWEMSFFYLMISINFQNLREISLIFFAKETLIFLLFFLIDLFFSSFTVYYLII